MSNGNGVLNLISQLTTRKIPNFAPGGSDGGEIDEGDDASILEGANVVCSKYPGKGRAWDFSTFDRKEVQFHAVLLDLDMPAYLVPSTTPGHSHLYINAAVREEDYFELLDVLAKCGIIEQGYASASKEKGGTYLRLPWVKKGEVAA